jgi:pyruvate kinase
VRAALAELKRGGWCSDDAWLVVITNALAHGDIIDSLQLRQVGGGGGPASA